MNICPECEKEMETGRQLCPDCAGEEKEDLAQMLEEDEALLALVDGPSFFLRQEETLVGRSDPLEGIAPDVDLSVHGGYETGVSRRHAAIHREGASWSLEDLGSTNGTVVNRRKVEPGDPVPLSEGDLIHLGHLKAVFHVGARSGGAS